MIKKKFNKTKLIILNFFKKLSPPKSIIYQTYLEKNQKHSFHIVSSSPWPFLTSFSAFLFVIGLVMYMHNATYGGITFIVGVLAIIVSMILWFQDIIRESTFMGYHSFKVQNGLRSGFLLFIVSEVMFFFAFFWCYFHSSLCPSVFIGSVWPPDGVVSFIINNENILSPLYTYDQDFNKNFYQISGENFNQAPGLFNDFGVKSWATGEHLGTKTVILFSDDNPKDFSAISPVCLSLQFYDDFDNEIFVKEFEKSLNLFYSSGPDVKNNLFFQFNGEILLTIIDSGLLINPLSIPLLNTIILLSSGAILTLSHSYLRVEKYFLAGSYLFLTIIFGLAFFGFQIFEYAFAGFSINDGVYGTTFFMLTGFHGFHVLIGTIFLCVCLVRFFYQHYTPSNHFGFEAAIWYWHFVDVVWLFLFFFVYLWPNYTFFYPPSEFTCWIGESYYHASITISTQSFSDSWWYSPDWILPPYSSSTVDSNSKKELIGWACRYIELKYLDGQNLNSFFIEKLTRPELSQYHSEFLRLWDFLLNIWVNTYGVDFSSNEKFETPFTQYEFDSSIFWYQLPIRYDIECPARIDCIEYVNLLRDFGYMGKATGFEHTEDLFHKKFFWSFGLDKSSMKNYNPKFYEPINFAERFATEIEKNAHKY